MLSGLGRKRFGSSAKVIVPGGDGLPSSKREDSGSAAAAGAAAVLGVRRQRSRQQAAATGPVVFARKAIDTIGNEVTRRLGS